MASTRTAHLFLFDGFADWEPALALCELRQRGQWEIRTFGPSPQVVSRGGLHVACDLTGEDVPLFNCSLLILPGGDQWDEGTTPSVARVLARAESAGIPIAAICGATLALARAGLLENRRHTSNSAAYLRSMTGGYSGMENYVDELAVTDRGVITASGAGAVEFAREILRLFAIYDEEEIGIWYDLFKRGVPPSSE
jgi:putative intracellular protease/amidase